MFLYNDPGYGIRVYYILYYNMHHTARKSCITLCNTPRITATDGITAIVMNISIPHMLNPTIETTTMAKVIGAATLVC